MRRTYPDAEFVAVTRTGRSILAPSKRPLDDYKMAEERLGDRWEAWDSSNYEVRYRAEIKNNPDAQKEIERISSLSEKRDVYVVCYEKKPPCHRFILLDIIKGRQMIKKQGSTRNQR